MKCKGVYNGRFLKETSGVPTVFVSQIVLEI